MLLVVAAGLLGLIWSSAVPFSYAPDEPYHFQIVDFIRQHGRLPVFGPTADMWVWVAEGGKPIESYSLYPPAAYVLAAVAVWAKPDWATAGMAARLPAAGLGALTVLFTWLVARRLWPDSPGRRLAAPAFVAALPSQAHLGAYLNVDALTVAVSAGSWWLLLAGVQSGWRWWRVLALGTALGVLLLSKYTAYLLVPVALAVLWLTAAPGVGLRPTLGRLWRLGAAATTAALMAGPWFARNVMLYGELIPERTLRRAFNTIAPDYAYSLLDRGQGPFYLTWPDDWWVSLHMSLWGTFGFASVPLPDLCYQGGLVVLLFASIGLLGYAWPDARAGAGLVRSKPRSLGRSDPAGSTRVVLTAMAFVFAGALAQTYLASWVRDYQPQARYAYAALVPFALGLITGLARWWPRRWAGTAAARWAALAGPMPLLALNLLALQGSVGAAFHGLEPANQTIKLDTPSAGATVNESVVRVAGWAYQAGAEPWQPAWLLSPRPYFQPLPVAIYAATPGAERRRLAGTNPNERPDLRRHFGDDPALAWLGYAADVSVANFGRGPVDLYACPDGQPASQSCASVRIELP